MELRTVLSFDRSVVVGIAQKWISDDAKRSQWRWVECSTEYALREENERASSG